MITKNKIIEAQKKWNIELKGSFLVGDRWKDIDAGTLNTSGTFYEALKPFIN
mgnify:CR=1 FL=1